MDINNLPEAPASVCYSIISPNGFPATFTVREMSGMKLLDKMVAIEQAFKEGNYKPQIKSFGVKKEVEYVQGRTCPQCGSRLVKKVSKQGKAFYKCEKGEWDFATQQNKGCPFVEWLP